MKKLFASVNYSFSNFYNNLTISGQMIFSIIVFLIVVLCVLLFITYVYQSLKNKKVIYNNNPILKWCFANTQAKVDLNGNIQPSKLNSKLKRIDGCVALIIAYAVLNRYKTDYENMIS